LFKHFYQNVRTYIYTYLVLQVNITTFELRMGSNPISSSEWELVRTENKRTSKLYSCCPNPFVDVQFKLVLRRRPTFASHLFIAPSVILCLITPTVFLLPTESFEKLTLGKFIALFLTVRRGMGQSPCGAYDAVNQSAPVCLG